MVRRSTALVLIAGLVLALPATAQDRLGVDAVDVAASLAELDDAGTPPTAAEIADYLAVAAVAPARGALSSRYRESGGGVWDQTARGYWSGSWGDLRFRWRRDRWGGRQTAGAARLGSGSWQLAAGWLGLPQGFGLLVGGPGRGPSLTADGNLSAKDRGLVSWLGEPEAQTIRGAGIQGNLAGWQVRIIAGQRAPLSSSASGSSVAQLGRSSNNWRVTAALLQSPLERGISAAGRFRQGGFGGSWEVAWRRPTGSASAIAAGLVQAGWQPLPSLRLEILSGWSDLGPRAVMAVKQPVLGDWAGQGLAVRGTWRLARGLGLKVLCHQAAGRQDVASGNRRHRFLSDIQLGGKWPGGWFAELRSRRNTEEIVAWSERFPWQPAALERRDERLVVSAKWGWRRDRKRVQVLWRRLAESRVQQTLGWEEKGARSLLSLSGVCAAGDRWSVRGAWTMAWGDDRDLVSAVVPFGGYVLPRHWGHWRAEQLVGAEYGSGPLQCSIAVSWRRAAWGADPEVYADQWTAWSNVAWRW